MREVVVELTSFWCFLTIASEIEGLPEVVRTLCEYWRTPSGGSARPARTIDHEMFWTDMTTCRVDWLREGESSPPVMLNTERCGKEILSIYRHILYGELRPKEFDPTTVSRVDSKRALQNIDHGHGSCTVTQ